MFLSVFIVSNANRNPQFGIMAVAIVFCFYTVVTLCGGEGGAEEDSSPALKHTPLNHMFYFKWDHHELKINITLLRRKLETLKVFVINQARNCAVLS